MRAWGVPLQQPGYRDHVPGLAPGPGWKHGELSAPWIAYRPAEPRNPIRVHVALWSWMAARSRDHPLFADLLTEGADLGSATLPVLVGRLAAWRALTGLCYRGIPGIAGTNLLRSLVGAQRARDPMWHSVRDEVAPHEREMNWGAAAGTPATLEHDQYGRPLVGSITLDRVRAYLASLQSIDRRQRRPGIRAARVRPPVGRMVADLGRTVAASPPATGPTQPAGYDPRAAYLGHHPAATVVARAE